MSDAALLAVLDQRRSTPSLQLGEPGPDAATVLRMLRSAVRVPDHGKLVPFRFIAIEGQARHALGGVLAARALQRDPQAPAAALDKDRSRFSHAQLVLAVIARLHPDNPKVPEIEQWMTAGSVCFALLQAAQALGFGAQWLTGWAAFDADIAATLGLGGHEHVAGFIHIGTPKIDVPERERPDPAALLTHWQPDA